MPVGKLIGKLRATPEKPLMGNEKQRIGAGTQSLSSRRSLLVFTALVLLSLRLHGSVGQSQVSVCYEAVKVVSRFFSFLSFMPVWSSVSACGA